MRTLYEVDKEITEMRSKYQSQMHFLELERKQILENSNYSKAIRKITTDTLQKDTRP